MKSFTHVSPSQVSTYLSCPRKWWFNKIMGLPVPQHPSAALGEKVHAGQEKYLETGDDSAVHPLAKGTLPLLRGLRQKVCAVERKIERVLPNGLVLTGRIDVSLPGVVLDWKTTSNPAYAKTEEELESDVQMNVYADDAFREDTALAEVEVCHVVIPTKGGTAPFSRKAKISRGANERHMLHFVRVTDEMLDTAKATSPADVRADVRTCSAYGGCPFRDKCAALKAVQKTPTANAEKNTVPSFAPQVTFEQMLATFNGNEAVARSLLTVSDADWSAWKAGKIGPAANAQAAQAAPVQQHAPTDVNPPESLDRVLSDEEKFELLVSLGWAEEDIETMSDEAFEAVLSGRLRKDECDIEYLDGNVEKVSKKAPPAPVVQAAAEEQPKRRRGRPPGAKNKPKEDEPVVEAKPEPVVEAKPEPVVEQTPAKTEPIPDPSRGVVEGHKTATEAAFYGPSPFALYIDCMPVKGGYFRVLEDVIAPLMRDVAENYKNPKTGASEPLAHYSLAPFNTGPAMVAASLMLNLQEITSGGPICVDSRSPCAAACLEVLVPVADIVVRGVRS